MTHAEHIPVRFSSPQDVSAIAELSELERSSRETAPTRRLPLVRQVIHFCRRKRASRPTIGVSVALICALALAPPGDALAGEKAGGGPVADWIDVTLKEIAGHGVNPPRASRGLALVSVALERSSRKGPAQIHGAAAEVLGYLFPDRREVFDARAAELAPSASNLRLGRAIGAGVVQRGRADRSDVAYTGTRPSGVGYWTEQPGVAGPLEPAAGQWLPWNMPSGSAYRPPPPPGPGDPLYAGEIQQVYDASQGLTARERAIALFWADGAGTETPPGRWNRIALDLIAARRLPAHAAARTLALLNTAQADAFIAAWDAKFAYWSERPVQAIRRTIDPNWSPLIPTPPFPGYVSGHSTTSGAASVVLAELFPSEARELTEMANEAAISRLYGGIHYPIDNDNGLLLGRQVGLAALERLRSLCLETTRSTTAPGTFPPIRAATALTATLANDAMIARARPDAAQHAGQRATAALRSPSKCTASSAKLDQRRSSEIERRRVRCIEETDFVGSERGQDEIWASRLTIDESAKTGKISPFKVGDFDDGTGKKFAPGRQLVTCPGGGTTFRSTTSRRSCSLRSTRAACLRPWRRSCAGSPTTSQRKPSAPRERCWAERPVRSSASGQRGGERGWRAHHRSRLTA